ncbi:MAG TPA: hypothetical protein VF941_12770 [Clostridia bacterium]
MSLPSIPNITPTISVNRTDVVNLLLASIALEEIGLAHIVNAEAEKIQFVLGTLNGVHVTPTVADLIAIDETVQTTLKDVIKKEMLLEFKLDEVMHIPPTPTP